MRLATANRIDCRASSRTRARDTHRHFRAVAHASASSGDDESAVVRRVMDFARTDARTLNDAVDASTQADIDRLIASGRVDGGISNAVRGDGKWEVFCAPHIQRLAVPLGVRFAPLSYDIRDGKIRSDVRHRGIVPDGWLSASGTVIAGREMEAEGKARPSCVIQFDKFWIGAGLTQDEPRDFPRGEEASAVDRAIDALGNAGFLDAFAKFPVLFYDEKEGLVIFQFPPLASNICARLAK